MKPTLPCIACGRALFQVEDMAPENQPYLGTEFKTHGHYGSTAYDMEMGHYLVVNICDFCLSTHPDRVMEGRDSRPIVEDGAIVGWEPVSWAPVPWRVHPDSLAHTLSEGLRDFGILEPDSDDEYPRIPVKIEGAVSPPERDR